MVFGLLIFCLRSFYAVNRPFTIMKASSAFIPTVFLIDWSYSVFWIVTIVTIDLFLSLGLGKMIWIHLSLRIRLAINSRYNLYTFGIFFFRLQRFMYSYNRIIDLSLLILDIHILKEGRISNGPISILKKDRLSCWIFDSHLFGCLNMVLKIPLVNSCDLIERIWQENISFGHLSYCTSLSVTFSSPCYKV